MSDGDEALDAAWAALEEGDAEGALEAAAAIEEPSIGLCTLRASALLELGDPVGAYEACDAAEELGQHQDKATVKLVAGVLRSRKSTADVRVAAVRALGRRPSGLRCFAWSIVGGVLVEPLALFDLSFLLSLAATAGLLVAAAPVRVPRRLLDQLAVGGRLVLPVGAGRQELLRIRRSETGYEEEELLPVRFVPMTGEPLD